VLSGLTQLTRLDISRVNLPCVPLFVRGLSRLQVFLLSGNSGLVEVPFFVSNLTCLKVLQCDFHTFSFPPQYILKSGTKAICKYLSDVDQGFTTSHLLKVMMLGYPKVRNLFVSELFFSRTYLINQVFSRQERLAY
jgi:hypothetical protein